MEGLKILAASFFFVLFFQTSYSAKSGFYLPDTVSDFTLRYKTVDNLIILPVKINDSLSVNLILDTGCRNIVLFGKRFQQSFLFTPNMQIKFSGMGSGKSLQGSLSLDNKASIGPVAGEHVPIVVVPSKNIFRDYLRIDGIIGHDIFSRFEIELNPSQRLITFRSAFNNNVPDGYVKIPMQIVDSKPILRSTITLPGEIKDWELLIDTGSTLGLLLKSPDKSNYKLNEENVAFGKGLNGLLKGATTTTLLLKIGNLMIREISTGIIYTPNHNYASIGMGVLKDYSIILNYAQSYACLKKIA